MDAPTRTRTRTRKPLSTESVADPAEVAPPSRRVPSPRAPTARRPATSSRTLRPVLPVEAPALTAVDLQVVAPPAAPPPGEEPALAAAPASIPVDLPTKFVAEPGAELSPQAASEPVTDLTSEPSSAPPPSASAPPVDEPPKVAVPGSELSGMVELLQADVRSLQGLVSDHTEQTAQELGKTTMQVVRMVTGMAHHLDQLVEHVREVTAVAQTLAHALTSVESTVAVMHESTQNQLAGLSLGQAQLQDELAPILGELVGLRAQQARNLTIERLEQFRSSVELKQLRKALEKLGATPAQTSAVLRASRAAGTKR